MDWSEKVLCIKCNEGGNLLVCSEDGCPLAVHEGCMGCPARFDDAGRYYCPYCFYKQAVAESRKAREYALAKKKALLLFMDEKMMGNEKHVEENKRAENNGHNESKFGKANEKKLTCNNGKSEANHDASLDQSMHPEKEQKIGNEEKVQLEESEDSSGSKGQDPSPKLHEEQSFSNEVDIKSQAENQRISNEEETRNQEEEQSIDNGEEEHDNMHKHKISNSDAEKIQEEISETPSPSSGEDLLLTMRARRARRPKRKKPVEQDSEAVSAQKYPTMKKKTSPTINPPMISSRRSQGSNQVVGSPPQKLKTPEKAIVKLPSNAFGCGKRKRQLWTEKEEEALKEGVEIFSKEANKNMPWRKILDMGRGVFDSSRTPSDLKDKWRNMSGKVCTYIVKFHLPNHYLRILRFINENMRCFKGVVKLYKQLSESLFFPKLPLTVCGKK